MGRGCGHRGVADEAALYWIDVKRPALHGMGLAGGDRRSWTLPADVGAFALRDTPGGAVVALRTGIHALDLAGGGVTLLAAPAYDPSRRRFNQGACDSAGRFWVCTMFDPEPGVDAAPKPATLSRFTLGGDLVPQPDQAELHNGAAWSSDERFFYLLHSNRGVINRYDYDIGTETLGPWQEFASVPQALGLPDGAAADEDGCYWCAIHGGGRLRRYAPDGRLVAEVSLPVSQPTMCAFAGPSLDEMFVTGASDKLDPEQLRTQPHAGAVFHFRPGVRGATR